MPTGLQVFNDAGTVQIDESWKNYGFRNIVPVTVTCPADPGQQAQPVNITLDLTGQAVLLAARAHVLRPAVAGSYLSGSNWSFNWRVFPPDAAALGVSYSETIDFYVFDVPPAGGFSNVGAELFNAAGERVFHTDMQVMKVRGVQPCSVDFVGTPGRIYAPLILLNPIRSEFTGSSYFMWTRALRVSANTITADDVALGGGAFLEFTNYGLYAAVDVTGLA
jgi:hypothetical protein